MPNGLLTTIQGFPEPNIWVSSHSASLPFIARDRFLSNLDEAAMNAPVSATHTVYHGTQQTPHPYSTLKSRQASKPPALNTQAHVSSPSAIEHALILDSRVTIEIDNFSEHEQRQCSTVMSREHQLFEQAEIDDSADGTCDSPLSEHSFSFPIQSFSILGNRKRLAPRCPSPDHDADDEGSIGGRSSGEDSEESFEPRGRTHTRKERRKGVEIDRPELQVATPSTRAERHSMERFRNALKDLVSFGMPTGTLDHGHLLQKRSSPEKKLENVRSMVKSLTGSLNRARGRMRKRDHCTHFSEGNDAGNSISGRAQHSGHFSNGQVVYGPTVRTVPQSEHDRESIKSDGQSDIKSVDQRGSIDDTTVNEVKHMAIELEVPAASWEQHLQQDLAQQRSRSKQIKIDLGRPLAVYLEGHDEQVTARHHAAHNIRSTDTKPHGVALRPATPTDKIHTFMVSQTPGSVQSPAVTEIEDTPQRPLRQPMSTAPSSIYSRIPSTAPSIPATNSSITPSISYPYLPRSERLYDILPSSESDPFIDNDSSDQWGCRQNSQPSLSASLSTADFSSFLLPHDKDKDKDRGRDQRTSSHISTRLRGLHSHSHNARNFSTLENFGGGFDTKSLVAQASSQPPRLDLDSEPTQKRERHGRDLERVSFPGGTGTQMVSIHPLTTDLVCGLHYPTREN